MEISNIYKYFRDTKEISNELLFAKRYDEPTYLSFRLMFDSEDSYNYTGFNVSNDQMPHPLFKYDDNPGTTEDIQNYSAVRYLKDANEPGRAKMMFDFINAFNELQKYNYFYFQTIDGIADLLKIDPTKGQRITNEKRLKITCLEGLDQRMTYLMNLYKKIVWDDTYQRWILPDMMRYFNLTIYLTEFRTFHGGSEKLMSIPNSGPGTADAIVKNNGGPIKTNLSSTIPREDRLLYLGIIDNILPMWQIKCEMCEFDITDVEFTHLSGLNLGGEPVQGAVKFGIKVGNIKEIQSYPVFKYIMSDKKLGGLGRLKEITTVPAGTIPNIPIDIQLGDITKPTETELKTLITETRLVQGSPVSDAEHISGLPYNEDKNSFSSLNSADSTFPIRDLDAGDKSRATNMVGKGESNVNTTFYDDKSGQIAKMPVDSTLPNTWVGNALDFGTNYAVNFAKKLIDKGKITPIPGVGASFTEISSALQSKDIITAFGLIRKAVNEVANEFVYPSSRLEAPLAYNISQNRSSRMGTKIVDNIMAKLILEITKSDATDEDSIALKEAANIILNDKGVWEKIKDYSLATNLVGKGEQNTKVEIKQEGDVMTTKEKSGATNSTLELGKVFDGTPSSKATNSKLE